MSSTSYPISMSKKDVIHDLRTTAKNRSDFSLTDSKVSGNKLWLGGMLTTDNARYYYVERHTLSSYAGQVSVKSESIEMGFTDNAIHAEMLKKLKAEWYWRRHDTVTRYLERVSLAKQTRAAKSAALKQLTIGTQVNYNGQTYRLFEKLGRKGWRVTDVASGQRYIMSLYRLKQATVCSRPVTAI